MRVLSTVLGALLVIMSLAVVPASPAPDVVEPTRCSSAGVPCGPVPVIVTFTLDKTRNLAWDADGKIALVGTLTYFFDVDQDGYAFDPDEEVRIAFKTPRRVDWADVAVEPPEIVVPIGDPRYISQDDAAGAPEQMSYEYTHDIAVTLTRSYEPTAEEVALSLRSDGQYRVLLAAIATKSTVDEGGAPVGLMEGYGVRELRIQPNVDTTTLDVGQPGGDAPGIALVGIVSALGAAAAIRRRR